jgi:hypothetical protein
MKLNFDKAQCFTVPEKLYRLLNAELKKLEKPKDETNLIIINFRDLSYSPSSGGFHPVEVRLEKVEKLWQLVYITDFSFQGGPYPELAIDIDVCFISKQIFSVFSGWLDTRCGNDLFELFINNFIEYYTMNAYQVSIEFS